MVLSTGIQLKGHLILYRYQNSAKLSRYLPILANWESTNSTEYLFIQEVGTCVSYPTKCPRGIDGFFVYIFFYTIYQN